MSKRDHQTYDEHAEPQAAAAELDSTPDEQAPAGDDQPASQTDELSQLTAECNDLRDKLMRAQAECANISKRLTQQHQQAMRTAGLELARALLPVLDNLERTVEAGAEATDAKAIADGVRLVRDEFAKVFKDFGVTPVDSIGQPFSPQQHEALFQDFESTAPAGTVTQELQRGFMMHDRVLRPAKVAVAADKPDDAVDEATRDGKDADSGSSAE